MRAPFLFLPGRIFVLFLFANLFAGQFAWAADLERAKALNQQGEKLLGKAQFQEAVNVFGRMSDACGDNQYCHGVAVFYLGRCYLELAQTDQAMANLRTADEIFNRLKKPTERAKVLHVTGRVFAAKSDYQTSLQWYDTAERILLSPGSRDDDELFWVRVNRAQVNTSLCRYDQASKDLTAAEAQLGARRDPSRLAVLRERRGKIDLQRQEYEHAQKAYAEALDQYRRAENLKGVASVLSQMGRVYEEKAQYDQALGQYSESLNLARRIPDPVSEAIALNNLGSVHWKRGNYARALEMFDQAKKQYMKLDVKHELAVTLNNEGLVYLAYGNYAEAVRHFEESLRIAEQVGTPELQGWACHNMAWVYRDQGKFEQAYALSTRAVETGRRIQDRKLTSTAVLRLGNLYEYYGDFEDALKQYEQAALIQKEIGDKLFESITLVDWANVLTREGKNDNLEQAQQKYEAALQVRRKIRAALVETLCRVALFYVEKDRYAQQGAAEAADRPKDLERAQQLIAEAGREIKPEDRDDLMLLRYVSGRYLMEQDPVAAIGQFHDLKSIADSAGSLKYSFLALVGSGLAYEKLQNWPEAEQALQQAVQEAEAIRDTLEPQARRRFLHGEEILGVKHILPFEALARVRMRMGRIESSWEASESAKARSFAEKLAQRAEGGSFGVEPALVDRLEKLERQIAASRQQMQKCLADKGDKSVVPDLQRTSQRLNKEYAALKGELRQKYPKFHDVRFANSIPLEKCALRDDEWTLSYQVTDTGVLVYLLKGRKIVEHRFQPMERKRLKRLVMDCREPLEVEEVEDLPGKLRSFNFKSGHQLARLLVGDILPALPEGVRVTIVPDDALGLIPFEILNLSLGAKVLMERKGPRVTDAVFFGDRNLVSYSQSTTALTLARALAGPRQSGSKVFVMTDPIFSEEDPRVKEMKKRQSREMGVKLPSVLLMSMRNQMGLRFVRLEDTKTLGDYLKSADPHATDLYDGWEASKPLVLKQDLSPYRAIVFATHGFAGDEIPGIGEPVIVLTLVNQPDGQDGFLKMSEVMSLKMNPDMVALTGCQTGLGRNVSGEGAMTMGRAFQYAGARAVLVSLWSVEQGAAIELVKRFFLHLRAGKGNTEALQLARSDIRGGIYDHPFYWAAFILVGEAN